MRYLKKFEAHRIGSSEYDAHVKSSNLAYSNRKKLVQSIVDNMSPKPEVMCEEIEEIFEYWKDEGVKFDDIELCTLKNDGDEVSIYYPKGWKGKVEKYYHPSFASKETDELITNILEKNPQTYYKISFGVDIDWDSEVFDPLYDTMRKCASELWSRLNSMYSIQCISSRCFTPGKNIWSVVDPKIGDIKTGTISWILKIND